MESTQNRRSENSRARSNERLKKRLEAGFARIHRALARQLCRNRRAASELLDRIDVWANEGGAESGAPR
jgi:hypothetical protein